MLEKETPEPINVETAIRALEQECHQMGRQDFEPSAFKRILKQWHNKEISDEEALKQAQDIRDSKQEY